MQEIIVKTDGITEKINPSMVFHSRNPMTRRFCVNILYRRGHRKVDTAFLSG